MFEPISWPLKNGQLLTLQLGILATGQHCRCKCVSYVMAKALGYLFSSFLFTKIMGLQRGQMVYFLHFNSILQLLDGAVTVSMWPIKALD